MESRQKDLRGLKCAKVYLAGNLLLEGDSIALRLADGLRKLFPDIEFIELEPTEDLPQKDELVIIDAAKGINDVELIDNLDILLNSGNFSLHDFDLAANLKLMKKLGMLKNVIVIAVPHFMDKEKALKKVCSKLRKVMHR